MLLRSPEELAHVRERAEYLSELNQAKDVPLLEWNADEAPNTYRHTVGKLTMVVARNAESKRWEWMILHERSGRLNSGGSEDMTVAHQEVVSYAIHYVKNAMVGVNA
jgi:hypothetical protein